MCLEKLVIPMLMGPLQQLKMLPLSHTQKRGKQCQCSSDSWAAVLYSCKRVT